MRNELLLRRHDAGITWSSALRRASVLCGERKGPARLSSRSGGSLPSHAENGLQVMLDAVGERTVDMATTRRQQEAWQRDATHAVREAWRDMENSAPRKPSSKTHSREVSTGDYRSAVF
jgi:hypothetical protein